MVLAILRQQELSPGTGLHAERMATLPVPMGVWDNEGGTPTEAVVAVAAPAATPRLPPEIPPTIEPVCQTLCPEAEIPPPPRRAATPLSGLVSMTTHH